MKAIAKVINPDKIQCMLQLTMTLEDWKRVRKTLNTNATYAEIQVIDGIDDLVCQLEKVYYANDSDVL